MSIFNAYVVQNSDDLIIGIVEANDEIDNPGAGNRWVNIDAFYSNPMLVQESGQTYDASFEWKFYAANSTGEFLGRAPYLGYSGAGAHAPVDATPVPTIPPDITHYSQTSEMVWDFYADDWFWPSTSLAERLDALTKTKIEGGTSYDGENYDTTPTALAAYEPFFEAAARCIPTDSRAFRKNPYVCINVQNQYIDAIKRAIEVHAQNCREAQKTVQAGITNGTVATPDDIEPAFDAAYAALVSVPITRNEVNISTLIADAIAVAVPAAVNTAIDALVDDAPTSLDTLKEFATALADNPNFAADIATALSGKVDKVTGKALSENDFTNALKAKLEGLNGNVTTQAGTITRGTGASSGTQDVSTSFQPSLVIFSAYDTDTNGDGVTSDGWDNGTKKVSTRTSLQNVLTTLGGLLGAVSVTKKSHANSIWIENGGTGWRANISALASDKFTLNWTKISTGRNITVDYIAIK